MESEAKTDDLESSESVESGSKGAMLPVVGICLLVLMAVVATVLMVITDSQLWTRIAVVIALWSAVIGVFLVIFYRWSALAAESKARELGTIYRSQLDQELVARQALELDVEKEILSRMAEESDSQLSELRNELAALRVNLERILGQDILDFPLALTRSGQAEDSALLPGDSYDEAAKARRYQESIGGWGDHPTSIMSPIADDSKDETKSPFVEFAEGDVTPAGFGADDLSNVGLSDDSEFDSPSGSHHVKKDGSSQVSPQAETEEPGSDSYRTEPPFAVVHDGWGAPQRDPGFGRDSGSDGDSVFDQDSASDRDLGFDGGSGSFEETVSDREPRRSGDSLPYEDLLSSGESSAIPSENPYAGSNYPQQKESPKFSQEDDLPRQREEDQPPVEGSPRDTHSSLGTVPVTDNEINVIETAEIDISYPYTSSIDEVSDHASEGLQGQGHQTSRSDRRRARESEARGSHQGGTFSVADLIARMSEERDNDPKDGHHRGA